MRRYSFATSIGDIRDDYKAHLPEVFIHLAKAYLFTGSYSYNYWKGQVWSFLHDIAVTKHNNRFPSEDELYQWFLDSGGDHPYKWLGEAADEYQSNTYTSEMLYPLKDEFNDSVLLPYIKWLNRTLSTTGYVNEKDAWDKIDELIDNLNRQEGIWSVQN